ncbi:GPW/gp25 family protein [Candidatus Uabimicrobium sp. HlEnr_7]|uniref:GPW/gp25 family protein n=1 Tax=Candidatus Uabimicrobium helgolandensis TaxID=3095367 RepID=UPI003557DBC4
MVDFLGKGIKFPLQLNPSTKKLEWTESNDSIKESIVMILQTSPGERVMRPDFGCELEQLVFAPNNTETAAIASYYVKQALEKWEPRIVIDNVVATATQSNTLSILIEYTIISDNTKANIVYPFYLENNS